MGRYHILLNKTPEVTPVVENKKIHQFGFEQDFQSKYKETQKKQRLFRLNDNESARIGFVHEEGRKDIFSGASIHFHGRTRFFCKSTSHRTALCCSSTYSGNHPTLRIAMPIIQYGGRDLALLEQHTALNYEIMPWVFGKIIFNQIKEINETYPVDQFDLLVTSIPNINNVFNRYNIQPAENSLWRQREDRELIIQTANFLRQTMMPYLAEDLDENAIETLLGPTNNLSREADSTKATYGRRLRSAVQQATEEDDSPPSPRERLSEPTALRNLDSVLDSI